MRPLALAMSVVALLAAGSFAVGCGSSDSSTVTKTATVPGGKLGASTTPPKLGYYAGIDCVSGSGCTSAYRQAREGSRLFCKGGRPNNNHPSTFTYQGRLHTYVCFTLQSSNRLTDFFHADEKIARSIYVATDFFPQTCDNGWCVSGEWSSYKDVTGQIRNPSRALAHYQAEWTGS